MLKFAILGSIIITLFWALIPQVIYLVVWIIGRLAHLRLSWIPWMWASLTLVVLWWGAYLYGHYWGRFRYEVKPVEYRNSLLPNAFDGYRIVQISDLHLDGWAGHASELWRVVKVINDLHPDLICFTGDLVSMDDSELNTLSPILQNLRAKDGIISVLGNHDYMPYTPSFTPQQREAHVQELIRREREELGWNLLLNQHKIIRRGEDSIAIIGVENQSCGAHQIIRRGRLKEAMQGTEGMYSILLSHDPTHWRAEVLPETQIPLTLSGHTHAMQMRLFGFTPSRWIYPECDGRYDEGSQTLYVNIGLGGTMPMRIGATPEITLFTLRR